MTSRELSRFALVVCLAAAMLAGCGGLQPPVGAPGTMPQRLAIATHAEGIPRGWILLSHGDAYGGADRSVTADPTYTFRNCGDPLHSPTTVLASAIQGVDQREKFVPTRTRERPDFRRRDCVGPTFLPWVAMLWRLRLDSGQRQKAGNLLARYLLCAANVRWNVLRDGAQRGARTC